MTPLSIEKKDTGHYRITWSDMNTYTWRTDAESCCPFQAENDADAVGMVLLRIGTDVGTDAEWTPAGEDFEGRPMKRMDFWRGGELVGKLITRVVVE